MATRTGLLCPLPDAISESIQRQGPSLSFEKFTTWLDVYKKEPGENVGQHNVFLSKFRHKTTPHRPDRHKRRRLSHSARKKLGLYKLGKTEVTFAQMLTVHGLWKDYMRKLLNIPELIKSKWNNSPKHPQFELMSARLYRADYHGAHLTVVKSVSASLVRCSGLVAIDTKNCFQLVGPDDVCRTVPKKSCEFEFELDRLRFTFYGHNFIVRPADRSNKKVKQVRPPIL